MTQYYRGRSVLLYEGLRRSENQLGSGTPLCKALCHLVNPSLQRWSSKLIGLNIIDQCLFTGCNLSMCAQTMYKGLQLAFKLSNVQFALEKFRSLQSIRQAGSSSMEKISIVEEPLCFQARYLINFYVVFTQWVTLENLCHEGFDCIYSVYYTRCPAYLFLALPLLQGSAST